MGYLTLTAPYDGVIVVRNANTGDFVVTRDRRPHRQDAFSRQGVDRCRTGLYGRPDRRDPDLRRSRRRREFRHKGTKATVLARSATPRCRPK